ncbi:hypothetical protein V8C34DRAFT_45270 [Trichoderma compactum]
MAGKPSDHWLASVPSGFERPVGGYGPVPHRRVARSSNPPATAMEVAPQERSAGKWIPPHLRTPRTMSVQTATGTHDDVEAKLEQTVALLSQGMDLDTQDAVVYRMDRLVRDLIASRKSLEDEKRKAADKDAEIAQLKQEVAYLRNKAREGGRKHEATMREGTEVRELEVGSVLASASSEEVNELQRLLAFHKTNGEQVSRKLRDLRATNKDIETQLQATEAVLREQMSLLSGLGICARAGAGSDSQEEKQVVPGRLEDAALD